MSANAGVRTNLYVKHYDQQKVRTPIDESVVKLVQTPAL